MGDDVPRQVVGDRIRQWLSAFRRALLLGCTDSPGLLGLERADGQLELGDVGVDLLGGPAELDAAEPLELGLHPLQADLPVLEFLLQRGDATLLALDQALLVFEVVLLALDLRQPLEQFGLEGLDIVGQIGGIHGSYYPTNTPKPGG